MARLKPLTEQRRCHNNVEGFDYEYKNTSFRRREKFCPNYVNMKKPRRYFWTRRGAEKRCYAYICDWCWDDLPEGDFEWPMDDNGRFMQTMECSLP